jgi:hypothetical protein
VPYLEKHLASNYYSSLARLLRIYLIIQPDSITVQSTFTWRHLRHFAPTGFYINLTSWPTSIIPTPHFLSTLGDLSSPLRPRFVFQLPLKPTKTSAKPKSHLSAEFSHLLTVSGHCIATPQRLHKLSSGLLLYCPYLSLPQL